MRQTFDQKVPLAEQRIRVANAKQPGRKHQHRIGPGKAAKLREQKRRHFAETFAIKRRAFVKAVREYWTGIRSEHP